MSSARDVRRRSGRVEGAVEPAPGEAATLRHNAHAVVIGIDTYHDRGITNLSFARSDAEAVYEALTDPMLGRFSPDNVILLRDEAATRRNIVTAIGSDIPRRAGKLDPVLIYYAGHGAPLIDQSGRSRDGMEKYLVPVDAEVDNLRATGISMDEIQRFFGWIESTHVLFFIDSCYAGAAGGRTFAHGAFQTRGTLTNDFLDAVAGEGRVVVTACDVNEIALEPPELRHGLFTFYLLQGLSGLADQNSDGLVSLQELYDYVYDNVSREARQRGGRMNPVLRGSIQGRLLLTAQSPRAQPAVPVAGAGAGVGARAAVSWTGDGPTFRMGKRALSALVAVQAAAIPAALGATVFLPYRLFYAAMWVFLLLGLAGVAIALAGGHERKLQVARFGWTTAVVNTVVWGSGLFFPRSLGLQPMIESRAFEVGFRLFALGYAVSAAFLGVWALMTIRGGGPRG